MYDQFVEMKRQPLRFAHPGIRLHVLGCSRLAPVDDSSIVLCELEVPYIGDDSLCDDLAVAWIGQGSQRCNI